MLISIVVNNYNYARFLGAAIDSALAQSHSEVEVVVVDDGSSDASRDVMSSYGSRIQVVLKENGGQASAFNAGFQRTSGDIVMFLDADDTLSPNAAAAVARAWRLGVSKVHFPLEVMDEYGRATGKHHPRQRLGAGDLIEVLLKYGAYTTAPTSGNAFCRRFLEKVLPIPESEWKDDADCYLVFLAPFHGPVIALPEALARYRVHGTSLTSATAGGRLRVEKLRKRLQSDIRQQKLLDGYANLLGYSMTRDAVLSGVAHYKTRLASLKSDPARHPFPEDTPFGVGLKLVRSVWSEDRPIVGRLAFSVWVGLVASAPKQLSKSLITPAFSPYSRSALFTALARSGRTSKQAPKGHPSRA